jgi:Flp pilus assembly protein TadD
MMPRPHIYLADIAKEAGQREEALRGYRRALTVYPEVLSDPERVVIHNNMGATHLAAGEYLRAVEEYQQALQLDSSYALARDGRDAAAAMFEQQQSPQADLLRKQGLNLMVSGQVGAAIQRFRRALELKPEPQTWMALALAYERQGDWASARRTYALLAQLDPDQPYARAASKRLRELEEQR